MLKDFFIRKKKYVTLTSPAENKRIAEKGITLDKTSDINSKSKTRDTSVEIEKTEKIKASRIDARKRIKDLTDKDTFIEFSRDLETSNPLDFPDYMEKVEKASESSKENEAVITGEGSIKGEKVILCVMNPHFMMGSMGSVVGEKITVAIETALEKRLPLIIFCASGGARMQEGILSLMQMAKTSAALARLDDEGLLYISVLTDPTTGGVTASFAMLGDIIIAEPGALIGFAGPRVIEQTIKQKLPEGFQRAEHLLEKGFIDIIVKTEDMRDVLSQLLKLHSLGGDSHE